MIEALLGEVHRLMAVRETGSGLYLDDGAGGEILLPGKYVLEGTGPGDEVEVFVYLDSEDRPVATTERPRLVLGQTGVLEVVAVHPKAGAFLDWGLEKDLLLPYREQEGRVRVGERVDVTVYVDERTGRLAATMKGGKDGRAERKPAVRERPPEMVGGEAVMALGERIVKELRASGGTLPLDDKSAPEAIRERFGTSKKVFKQAVGGLYRERRVRFLEGGGIELTE